jgi:iron complex transport system ATP-binding protein
MASSKGSAIGTRGLWFSYGARDALCAVDMQVEPGEVVGVLGPNGSGKSTLIRVLSGVLPRYTGSATLEGREVREIGRRELAREMAVVQQEPGFSFAFTALEIVLMGRHPHLAGLAFESERDIELARTSLELCGAGALASRPIHELSSGERQRVVFARALAQQPRALLLDEPASFLDIRHQVELYDTVRRLVEDSGCSVLTVLHDLNLAAEYCDRIYLLREGRVEARGQTEEVFTYHNLKRVFETEVYVDTNALTGRMLVVPLPGRVQEGLREE